ERRLCAHPFLELYRDGQIQFIVPLARQGDFYVPEVRQAERRLSEQEESHSDTDISGQICSILELGSGAAENHSEGHKWQVVHFATSSYGGRQKSDATCYM
ncbi:hypothetical protein GOODEAATRI_012862, partial [Goodea atripinnis]